MISLSEVSAGHQRDAHRLRIARSSGFIIEAHVLVFTRHVAVDEGIIREAMERRYWPPGDALGRRMKLAKCREPLNSQNSAGRPGFQSAEDAHASAHAPHRGAGWLRASLGR